MIDALQKLIETKKKEQRKELRDALPEFWVVKKGTLVPISELVIENYGKDYLSELDTEYAFKSLYVSVRIMNSYSEQLETNIETVLKMTSALLGEFSQFHNEWEKIWKVYSSKYVERENLISLQNFHIILEDLAIILIKEEQAALNN